MPTKFHQILKGIGKACQAGSFTEAEVEKIFQEKGFFVELGYQGFGKDLLAQRGKARKRFDVALTGFGGRVHAIMEFKQKSAGILESFRDELYDKYVQPQVAVFGVLTNGEKIIVYARANGQFPEQMNVQLSEITEGRARDLENWLHKKSVHLASLESVLEQLRYHRQNQLLISDASSEPARIFFQVFQLRPESAFGRLVLALKECLPKTIDQSRFTRGSYEFWLKTYARPLKYKNIPESWRPFLGSKASAEIAQFSFALETAYTIVSRLILAKAADDRRFPGVRFVPRIQESLSELAVRDKLKPEDYREIVERSFKRASQALFSTIFLQDIFDWWFEQAAAESHTLCQALGEAVLAVTQFDFSELSGDLLGELYQLYFDRDTRKALGEFYTPPEVIEFILDECGYKGQAGSRLLDPACGSGSFLTAALRRYLDAHRGKKATQVLSDLADGLRIVGFDINPFAVLMAQVNYAALILPFYAEAINEDRDFRVLRLPVFRTDSLRIEEREDEGTTPSLTPHFKFEEKTLDVSIYLPIKGEKKTFHRVRVKVPRYLDAKSGALVANLEEYVAALACVFQSVRDGRYPLESLLRSRFREGAEKLHTYVLPAKQALEATVEELRGKYDDGRFLKTIEDLVLAVSLKHDLQYDFVVGNPPYVRIQKIPEHVKEYWEGKYEWTEHNYDLYIPFLERAVRSGDKPGWLGKGGRLGFILSDRFLNVNYGQKLREEMPRSARIDVLLDLRDTRVFAAALNYPAILIAERAKDGKEGNLVAARAFTSEADATAIFGEFDSLKKKLTGQDVVRGETVEVFSFPRKYLGGPGWWLMPESEQRIFTKLRQSSGESLIQLTESQSAAFQGYSTSADSHLVFDELEDLGETLKVWARHESKDCGCGEKPLEIEKGALRPFLFGKDVARWSIDRKRTWVMFPYDRYEKKRILNGEVIEEWNLIPCKANLDEFEFLDPEKVELFEKRFPKAWKYLCKHESTLRAREDNRYASGKSEAHLWYGATYPRGLDYYFRPKLVLQLLSRRNSFALDVNGDFVFQAGGKGGGVYGIAPNEEVGSVHALLAFLNSKVTDFLLKQISSVYGGRFYSYADQFLKDLPIAQPILESGSKVAERLEKLSKSLSAAARRRADFARKLAGFPGTFESDLRRYELDAISKLSTAHPATAQLSIEPEAVSVEKALYGFEVRYGSQRSFEFEDREHAKCLEQAILIRKRRTLPLDEVLRWRLPVKGEGCKKLLDLLAQARSELADLDRQIADEEGQLNDAVYGIYKVTDAERSVIEDFLNRYSSVSAAELAEIEEAEGGEE